MIGIINYLPEGRLTQFKSPTDTPYPFPGCCDFS